MIGWEKETDEFDEDWSDQSWQDRFKDENQRALSDRGIEEANRGLLRRYRDFRHAADAVTAAWREYRQVAAVSLIGSVARDPWKEVPRFAPYRRARIELWHECKDVDLALWPSDMGNLNDLRRARARALRAAVGENRIGVATHQVDAFILEPGTDRYLGRLCDFNACPRGKPECRTPGCGNVEFLRPARGIPVVAGEPCGGPRRSPLRPRRANVPSRRRFAASRRRRKRRPVELSALPLTADLLRENARKTA